MIKFIFAAIIFGLIAIAIIVMVVINFMYKGVKKIREEVEDNYYRNQKIKEQKEKNPFDTELNKLCATRTPLAMTISRGSSRSPIRKRKTLPAEQLRAVV